MNSPIPVPSVPGSADQVSAGSVMPARSAEGPVSLVIPAGKKVVEHKGVLYSILPPTCGWTGPGWLKWYKDNAFPLGPHIQALLLSESFVPTVGVSYAVAAIRSSQWPDMTATHAKAELERSALKFTRLPVEATCMMRQFFSDDELKLMRIHWIRNMHKPAEFGEGPLLSSIVCALAPGLPSVNTTRAFPDGRSNVMGAFAYALTAESQVTLTNESIMVMKDRAKLASNN